MPEFIQFLSTLRQHMNAELTRSDVLRSLIWPNGGLLLGLSAALTVNAPYWVLLSLVIMLAVFMGLYAFAYIFFALTDADALRSEKYKLQKMAIEQGLYGDSHVGLLEMKQVEPKTLPAITSGPEDVDE